MRAQVDVRQPGPILAGAIAMVAASGIWFWHGQAAVNRWRREPIAAKPAGAAYQGVALPGRPMSAVAWPEAVPQPAGSRWIYDVFTPPAVEWDRSKQTFSVTLAGSPVEEDRFPGFDLIEVKREPFRLQIQGYFGAPGDYVGVFVRPGQPGTLLARAGHRFGGLDLRLVSLEVNKVVPHRNEGQSTPEFLARAIVRDEASGEEVILESGFWSWTNELLALCRRIISGGEERTELRAGEVWSDGIADLRIERIQLSPPEVVVTRERGGRLLPSRWIFRPGGVRVAAFSEAGDSNGPGVEFSPASEIAAKK